MISRTRPAAGSGGAIARAGSGGAAAAAGARAGAAAGARAGESGSADAGGGGGSKAPPVDRSAEVGPNSAAFDPSTGALVVDYASYLAKHDLVFKRPQPDPIQALSVGNGTTGAMVWNANGLTMQLSGVDTSPQTAFSAGLANLSTMPALDDAVSGYEQRLVLHDGTLVTRYGRDRSVTVIGVGGSEVLGIHVEDSRELRSVSFELSLWDLSSLENTGAARDLNTWKTVTTFADADVAGLSRGQSDPDRFGYTLAASVEGTDFTARAMGSNKVELAITPAHSFTIWIAVATRKNAADGDSVARARLQLEAARKAGYADARDTYTKSWHDFWAKSFVQYSNASGVADYLENIYYLATYMIAAGSNGKYPFHFINGVFRATRDQTKWSNAYWYWNQRDVYNAFLASNHPEVMSRFNALYSDNAERLRKDTRTRYQLDAIWVPETMGWNGNADGTVGSDFTKNIFSTGYEAAANMVRQYAYTGDRDYLQNTVYPFLRDVAQFYVGKLTRKSDSGQYVMLSSNAHETYWNVPNAITDLAAVRSMFPMLLELSEELGRDEALRSTWRDILEHLAPYPTNATDYLPHDPPQAENRNGENVACELIWPYSVTGIGAPDYQRALDTWKHRPHPYDNIWANDAVQAARLGLGDETLQGMVTMLQKYQSYPNGMTNNTNGVFEYLGVHLAALNEALLQSYGGKIRVFPALPRDAGFISRFTLAAEGGFLVSSEREGAIKYVGVRSLLGKPARIVNPWPGERVQVRQLSDGAQLMAADATELSFETQPGASYVVERESAPFASFGPAHVGGQRSSDVRELPNTSCSLGLGM